MKRLSILAGLAMLALATPTPSEAACNNWDTECLKKEAAQGQQGWPKEMPAECTGYGAANTKPAHCAQWEGWQPGMPPPGQGTPGQGTGTWQPPPGQQKPPPGTGTTWTPDQVMCPKNSVWDQQAQRCLFKKADTTTQRCQPGWVWVTYGNKGKCVKRGGTQEQTGPLDEAHAYRRLTNEFAHTQEALAEAIGEAGRHVTNTLRLLTLPASVQELVEDGRLSAGHARALVGSPGTEALAQTVVEQGLNVRQTEALVRLAQSGTKRQSRTDRAADPNVTELSRRMSERPGAGGSCSAPRARAAS